MTLVEKILIGWAVINAGINLLDYHFVDRKDSSLIMMLAYVIIALVVAK